MSRSHDNIANARPTDDATRRIDDVVRRIDHEGRLPGSGVEAHRIAALIDGGMSLEDVVGDYPNLDAVQVDAAVRYAAANPWPRRHFPKVTAKSVLRDGSGGGLAEAFAGAHGEDKSQV